MPVIRDIHLKLETKEVLRREGFTGYAGARPEIKDLTIELLANVETLIKPAIAYEIYGISEISKEKVNLENNLVINGTLIPSTFPEAKELALAVCTIGTGLEGQVTAYSRGGQALKGVLLDGIGSAAVDSLIIKACSIINNDVSVRNYQVGSPLNPGMPGLPLAEQWNLLSMVPAKEIGVSLTASGIMVPRKSTSIVLGIGKRMQKWEQAQVCANCNLNQTCPYRIHA